MNVTITLIICLSVVFVITLGIISCTLRDENFKVRFDDRNKRLSRIIKDQRDELHSYREAIKKNDANLEKSLEVLASASDVINTRISRLKDTEELLSMVKVKLGDLNLGTDKISKKMDEAIRSFSSCVKKIENNNEVSFKHFEQYLVNRPSYLSPDEKKHFKEYMQSAARGYTFISNMPNKMDFVFVRVEDVYKALEFVGRDQWDSLYIKYPSEEEFNNGQNTERN
nr:MAG TPA: DNA replication complex GINS protein complex, Eukaryotic DNA replication [Caudoviricetes sp.]